MQFLESVIALGEVRGVGLRTAHALLKAYGSDLPRVFTDDRQTVEASCGMSLRNCDFSDTRCQDIASKELEFIDEHGIRALVYGHAGYPQRLLNCDDAPLVLYTLGNFDVDSDAHYVSVVGTRSPTSYGKDVCSKIVSDLAALVPNVVIISGLAYGIDVAAHRAALKSGVPTLAVMGHGLDRVYPSTHRDTAKKIIENGALITEYHSGTQPDGPNFVQRDRIIAGLADVVIVVESKSKGGSLITAHYALEYNRDVMAVPGRINDDVSSGCNQLIKRNVAALVESAQDIVGAMAWDAKPQPRQTEMFEPLTADEQKIADILAQYPDGLQVNDIVPLAGLPFHKISALLFSLEDKNLIAIAPGSVYRMKLQ